MNVIDHFEGKYSFLSNFYASLLHWTHPAWTHIGPTGWMTLEHAYQAAKTPNKYIALEIASTSTPGQAKRAGRKIEAKYFRKDWEEIKDDVMLELLRIKFSDPYLREKLMETGNAVLIEGNTWHDNYWGRCRCQRCESKMGNNMLGVLLMQVRQEIKDEQDAGSSPRVLVP